MGPSNMGNPVHIPKMIQQKVHFIVNLKVSNTPKGDIVIILGDFNPKIGNNNNNGGETIMGHHALGTSRGNNGERLIEFCAVQTFLLVVPVSLIRTSIGVNHQMVKQGTK